MEARIPQNSLYLHIKSDYISIIQTKSILLKVLLKNHHQIQIIFLKINYFEINFSKTNPSQSKTNGQQPLAKQGIHCYS